jgi:hypothetical protein
MQTQTEGGLLPPQRSLAGRPGLTRRTSGRVAHYARAEPLRAGLVALGLGLVVGRLARLLANRLHDERH